MAPKRCLMLAVRGIIVSHQTIRLRTEKFGRDSPTQSAVVTLRHGALGMFRAPLPREV